ncbi:hypothetical protein OG607_32950 [Streptomyces sp. NBC_01537]|uniref:hypothetical protein n=1 Tax=Streptomyces sp. NBC_01537 TaxID=2903896 RepID=UPI003867C4E0
MSGLEPALHKAVVATGSALGLFWDFRLHQDVLARSPFSRVNTAHWDRTLTRTLDEVIGQQFSTASAVPPSSAPAKAPSSTSRATRVTQDGRTTE